MILGRQWYGVHHLWKKTTQHLKIDGHAHLQGQLLSYKRLDGAPPPSNRLICWDEVTFFTLQEVLFVVGFCWFRLEILPVFVAPPWSEVWQSLSFAENCLAWLRGFNLRGSCLLIFELLFPSSILVDYELWIQVVALAAQLSLPNEQPSSSSTICPRF